MSQKNRRLFSTHPSRPYVFVVISLATFLFLLAIGRRPQIRYQVAVSLTAADQRGKTVRESEQMAFVTQVVEQCSDEESIHAALATVRSGDPRPPHELMSIAQDISRQLSISARNPKGPGEGMQIALITAEPAAGIAMLNHVANRLREETGDLLRPSPAKIVNRRSRSMSTWRLFFISLVSGAAGLAATWLSKRLQPPAVLRTRDDIAVTVELPILDLAGRAAMTSPNKHAPNRQWMKVCITVAEVGIAAVFLLMLYNLVTTEMFSARFFADPLAAYGEALTQLMS